MDGRLFSDFPVKESKAAIGAEELCFLVLLEPLFSLKKVITDLAFELSLFWIKSLPSG